MKQQDKQLIVYGGGILVLYFGLIRPILTKLGIQQTQQQQQQQQQIQTATTSLNIKSAWSPLFWKNCGAGAKILTKTSADVLAKKLYDAFGYFSDDETAVYSVFRQLKTKSQNSFLVDRFRALYGLDLLEFMKRGKGVLAQAGLNNDELSIVLDIVNKLPDCK
jgi:hypothetical protein